MILITNCVNYRKTNNQLRTNKRKIGKTNAYIGGGEKEM